jgi:DNA-binding NarL/FixJ family response regulator
VKPQEGSALTAIRVCVFDDQTLFRESLAKMLESQPGLMVVGEAADGDEAIRRALSLKPDVILMDIGLPKVDGLQATRQIKDLLPGVRVIGITAYPNDEVFRRALSAGFDSFLLKDASLDELVATIRLTHGGSRLFNGTLLRTFMRVGLESPLGLTDRERQVLQAMATGLDNRAIAARLHLSEKTVRNHVSTIYSKLAVTDRAHAVLAAIREGIAVEPGLQGPRTPQARLH